MKQYCTSFSTVTLFGLLMFSCVAYLANAQSSTSSTFYNPNLGEPPASDQSDLPVSQRNNGQQNQLEQKSRAVLTARQQERFTNLASNVANRIDATIARLTTISNRLESRIDIVASDGTSVAEAEQYLTTAMAHLEAAEQSIATIDTDISTFVTANNPHEAWTTLRSNVATAKTNLVNARSLLLSSIQSLRTPPVEPETE